MINELIYVYCISNSPNIHIRDIESHGLKTLRFGDFNVIIKYVSYDEFSEENFKKNVSDYKWLETNAREHIGVISKIMEQGTVIPFKFGTIYMNHAGLEKFITDYSASLIENFYNLEGKEEWSVKIYCDRKSLSEKIDELSEEASELEKQIMASSPGKAFLLRRKKSDLIENEMDRLCKRYGQEYYDEFNKLSQATVLNNLLPKEFTGRQDTMILTATFFVLKSNVSEFKDTVNRLRKKDGNSAFFIEATGPWPPFSFISIKEKK
jgi:hypothetical protein